MKILALLAVVIGISTSYSNGTLKSKEAYSRAIIAAGGAPVMLPLVKTAAEAAAVTEALDGLMMTGGEDVAPWRYGEEPLNATVKVNAVRDTSDFLLMEAARRKGIPIMGICRGLQEINVFFGGTLYQDIPSQKPSEIVHKQKAGRTERTHAVIFEKGSALRRAFRSGTLMTNSFHHEAVKDVAPGLKITARAGDGIVEGIESERSSAQYILAVQFHPEDLTGTSDGGDFLNFFKTFTSRCRKNKSKAK